GPKSGKELHRPDYASGLRRWTQDNGESFWEQLLHVEIAVVHFGYRVKGEEAGRGQKEVPEVDGHILNESAADLTGMGPGHIGPRVRIRCHVLNPAFLSGIVDHCSDEVGFLFATVLGEPVSKYQPGGVVGRVHVDGPAEGDLLFAQAVGRPVNE